VEGFACPVPRTFGRTAPVILDRALMSRLTHGEVPSNHVSVGSERSPCHRISGDSNTEFHEIRE
jgi:hypothetical protein